MRTLFEMCCPKHCDTELFALETKTKIYEYGTCLELLVNSNVCYEENKRETDAKMHARLEHCSQSGSRGQIRSNKNSVR
jgi:hypothetical protein